MKNDDFKQKYLKAQSELAMLYEIGNMMHTTLNLEEILYIILTAVTAHVGLSFNRAMLFLVNGNQLEGKMGIGPDSAEDADKVWSHIEEHKIGLEELIKTHRQFEHLKKSQLNKTAKSIKLPINFPETISLTATKGTPFIINSEEIKKYVRSEFTNLLDLEDFITVPLKARDKVIGVIVADNRFNKRPVSDDDVRMLTMFANQAGLAIENSRLYERTVYLSHTDSLTDLWHHGHFQYLMGKEIKKSSMEKTCFSLLMIDIDNFKNYNDTYGHPAGDRILKNISNIFRDVSRKIDIIARYGGEEFSVILPHTKKEEALILAERVRKSIEGSENLQNITVSIGVSSFPEDGEDNEALITKADRALYEAKRTGKNKVCV